MNFKKKLVSIITVAVMLSTVFIPCSAFAGVKDGVWDYPTEPMSTNDNVVTVGAHAAANTAVHYLGANLVTERLSDLVKNGDTSLAGAQKVYQLAVFGSDVNDNPNPYSWNYFYNKYAAENGKEQTGDLEQVGLVPPGSPMIADTTIVDEYGTSVTLARRPDILYGTDPNKATEYTTYDELLALLPENTDNDTTNDYKPLQIQVQSKTIYTQIDTMYDLAAGIKQVAKEKNKKWRYDDPEKIAQEYEKMVKAPQYYVLSQINKGKIKKKTIAVIDPTSETGKFKAYDSNTQSGTAASCRACEYLESTTNNLLDTLKTAKADDGQYYLTAAELVKADVIIITPQVSTNVTGEAFKEKLIAAGVKEADIPSIYSADPNLIFGIKMNSVENVQGVGIYLGFVYPEVINPVYNAIYIFKNFYHISNVDTLKALTVSAFKNASLADGIKGSYDGYTDKYVKNIITEGLSYYKANKAQFKGKKLELTDKVSLSGITADVTPAKVASLSVTAGKNSATLKWKKVSKATGYAVYRATSKTGKYKAVKTVTSGKTVKYTDKSLKKGKTYYYKVKAYKKASDGKKIYGAYSAVKSVKVK